MEAETFFVDTNVFLRYLTNDVPAQADAVEFLLQRAAKGKVSLVGTEVGEWKYGKRWDSSWLSGGSIRAAGSFCAGGFGSAGGSATDQITD